MNTKQPKRFAVFGHGNQPLGGWDDFFAAFDTLEEAQAHVETLRGNCYFSGVGEMELFQIVDLWELESLDDALPDDETGEEVFPS